jgi:hypothetical protein
VVLIAAEPGIGKSRLAEALAERISGEPHVRLRYFCSPHHQESALYPVIAQMERAAGFAREDTAGAKLAKLRKLLGPADGPPLEFEKAHHLSKRPGWGAFRRYRMIADSLDLKARLKVELEVSGEPHCRNHHRARAAAAMEH